MKQGTKPQSVKDLVVLDPDRYHLDIESVYQPKLSRVYSDMVADARAEVEYAKAHLKFVSARLYRRIQMNPAKFGLGKYRVTEKAIEAAMEINKKRRVAEKALIEAKKDLYELEGVYEQVKQRMFAVQNLTKLHGQAYFSVPRISREAKEEYEEYLKKHIRKNSIHRRDK